MDISNNDLDVVENADEFDPLDTNPYNQ